MWRPKNGWTTAEFADDSGLGLGRREDRQIRYVISELGDPGRLLIANETGFEKATWAEHLIYRPAASPPRNCPPRDTTPN